MSIWDVLGGVVNKITGRPSASERREQQSMMNNQIKAYKDQTELSRQEMNKAKDSQAVEQRRIQEKQIRTLRNHYRPAGILGSGNTGESDMTQKLGG